MREEERQLIRRLVVGDVAAEHQFVSMWHPRIYVWAARHTWVRPIDDCVQQIWYHLLDNDCARLLQWQGLYDDDAWHTHSLEGYLKTLAINKLRDIERAEARRLPPAKNQLDIIDEDGPLGTDPEVQAERYRLTVVFESCFVLIQANDQRLLEMWHEGHPDEDIALELGITPNNVAQRRFQALRRLRDCLREKLPEYLRHV